MSRIVIVIRNLEIKQCKKLTSPVIYMKKRLGPS
jgi:hypothetical protein